jgi:hypothetical protein
MGLLPPSPAGGLSQIMVQVGITCNDTSNMGIHDVSVYYALEMVSTDLWLHRQFQALLLTQSVYRQRVTVLVK